MTNLDIETFWAVVHHGTMTAAAESLYITQPTLSMRIRALEERVGTALAAAAGGDGLPGGAGTAGVSAHRRHLHHQPVHPAAGVQALSGAGAAGVPVDPHPAGCGYHPGAAEP